MEWKSDSLCHSHTYPGQECWSPGRCSSGELEFRDCGAIPWKGCCWLLRDRLRGCEGDHGGKCWWKRARQPQKQGDTAESRVGGGAITIASFSPHKHQQLNRKAGPSNQWHSELQSRSHPGFSFQALTADLQRRTPSGRPIYVPEWVELWRKTDQRGLLMASYKKLEKRLLWGHNSYGGGSLCPRTLVTPSVPAS